MNKLMLVAALMIASVSAHASKARLSSLQNAKHLMDIRDAFDGEAEETLNYEAAIVEFGVTTGTPNAEGGFIRKMGDASLGFYVGKDSATFAAQAGAIAAGVGDNADEDTVLTTAVEQENPFIVTYASKMGDMAWGVGLFAANKDKEGFTADSGAEDLRGDITQDVMGVYAGVNNGVWDAQLRVGLMGNIKFDSETGSTITNLPAGATLKGNSTMNVKLSGGYKMDTVYYYGSYEGLGGEAKINGTKVAESEATNILVGAINSMKKDGVDFFYGVSVESAYAKNKLTGAKSESLTVPVLVGVEADVNSWMVMRGAIKQSLPYLSTSKVGGDTETADSSTTTTLGMGFKWGKAIVDVVAGMGTTGEFVDADGGNIFTNASMTYTF